MTGIELFRKLKESGTGQRKLGQMRGYLQGNHEATADHLIQGMRLMAVQATRSGEIADGTIRKAEAIRDGQDHMKFARPRPIDWDEQIDGPYTPGALSGALPEMPNVNSPSDGTPKQTTNVVSETSTPPPGSSPQPLGNADYLGAKPIARPQPRK